MHGETLKFFFLCFAYYTSNQTSGCALGRIRWRREGVLKWRQLKNNYALSLSLWQFGRYVTQTVYKVVNKRINVKFSRARVTIVEEK